MLSRESEYQSGRFPSWLGPTLLCGAALLGGLGLAVQFEQRVENRQSEVAVQVGGAGGIETTGDITEAAGPTIQDRGQDEEDLDIEREVEPNEQGIGSLDPGDLFVDPRSSELPWSALGAVEGLLTFRGNPTRTYHGSGPLPERPRVLWSTEIGCSNSSVGGVPKVWCGTGWTGQPAVFRAPRSTAEVAAGTTATDDDRNGDTIGPDDRQWWVGIGGYNRNVNFFNPDSGDEAYPPFETGDIIKGSITVDPDGYPLVYTGSRDNFFHIAAIDGDEPRELWRLSADDAGPTLWNDDWDSSAIIVDDYLLVGGENSRFYVVELNRGYAADGSVTVDPEVVFSVPGWDSELLASVGDQQVSIENSVAVSGGVVYFTNSGGLVQGWDLSNVAAGRDPEQVFRYWTGDDTDASIIIDGEGMLYVASEYERGNSRARELGQVIKLDPSRPDDPLVWSREAAAGLGGGVWATPALYEELVLVSTDDGRVLGIDAADGDTAWTLNLPGPLWSSPVVVDDTLVQGDCDGTLHAFDLRDHGTGRRSGPPPELWTVELGGCIESTPAVWDGRIFVGTRSGQFFGIGDR